MQIAGLSKAENNEIVKYVSLADDFVFTIPYNPDVMLLIQNLKTKLPSNLYSR